MRLGCGTSFLRGRLQGPDHQLGVPAVLLLPPDDDPVAAGRHLRRVGPAVELLPEATLDQGWFEPSPRVHRVGRGGGQEAGLVPASFFIFRALFLLIYQVLTNHDISTNIATLHALYML